MWQTAIDNHKKLIKARPDPSYWSDNIIDATKCLGNEESEDWKIFYSYLCESPIFFDPEKARNAISIGDLDVMPAIPDYPEGTTFECHQNGNEYTIIVKPIRQDEDDDEKVQEEEEDDEKVEFSNSSIVNGESVVGSSQEILRREQV